MPFTDCHCHIGVDGHLQDPAVLMEKIKAESRVSSKGFFNVMSTYHLDLKFLEALIDLDSDGRLIPHFGVHPWYSHLFSVDPTLSKSEHYNSVIGNLPEEVLDILPQPIDIEDHIKNILNLVKTCEAVKKPYAIGEIGLDRLFRVPTNGFYGNQEHKHDVKLTSAKVSAEHQKKIFLRQLDLANELRKPVSLHCVKAQGQLFDIVHSSFLEISSVTLHSYTGSPDQAKRWIKESEKQQRKLFFSFSNCINVDNAKSETLEELIHHIPTSQILFESDLPIDRYFLRDREDDYFEHLHKIQTRVSEIKGLSEVDCNALILENSFRLHDL